MKPILYTIILQPQVEDQIDEHYLWLLPHTSQHAASWVKGVHAAIFSLDLWPKSHPVAEESEDFGCEVRKMPYGSHVILFTVDDAKRRVEILAVRAGARRAFG